MGEQVILTVGNSMMGDDAAGPLLAALLERSPASGWQVIDGGLAPENVVHRVRAVAPRLVVVFDAVEMGLEPGQVRVVDERLISRQTIMTTHDLPVSFLMAALRETVHDVRLLGVQPSLVAFGYPVSTAVEQAILNVHAQLLSGMSLTAWPMLRATEDAPCRLTSGEEALCRRAERSHCSGLRQEGSARGATLTLENSGQSEDRVPVGRKINSSSAQ